MVGIGRLRFNVCGVPAVVGHPGLIERHAFPAPGVVIGRSVHAPPGVAWKRRNNSIV